VPHEKPLLEVVHDVDGLLAEIQEIILSAPSSWHLMHFAFDSDSETAFKIEKTSPHLLHLYS
jgi:hypothetical protein